jgi:hypothetical protein
MTPRHWFVVGCCSSSPFGWFRIPLGKTRPRSIYPLLTDYAGEVDHAALIGRPVPIVCSAGVAR